MGGIYDSMARRMRDKSWMETGLVLKAGIKQGDGFARSREVRRDLRFTPSTQTPRLVLYYR
ncbi:MAG: hypothetical protein J7K94_01740 [Dehalococcoidia bacterium]|nr:hypothetical protein [Dehalococcoidia bacterium]